MDVLTDPERGLTPMDVERCPACGSPHPGLMTWPRLEAGVGQAVTMRRALCPNLMRLVYVTDRPSLERRASRIKTAATLGVMLLAVAFLLLFAVLGAPR